MLKKLDLEQIFAVLALLGAIFSTALGIFTSEAPGAGSSSPVSQETIQLAQPTVVNYGFVKSNGEQGMCMGTSISASQFLTSAHCVKDLANQEKSFVLANAPSATVEHIDFVDSADIAMVTLDGEYFAQGCVPIWGQPLDHASELDLFRIDLSTGKTTAQTLVVDDNDYKVFNPDLGIVLDHVIATVPLTGELSKDGDSGAPAIVWDDEGQAYVAGILMGISRRNQLILFEPASKSMIPEKCEPAGEKRLVGGRASMATQLPKQTDMWSVNN